MAYPTTEDCLRISLKRMREIWKLGEGCKVMNTSLQWSRNGEKTADIAIPEYGYEEDGTGILRIGFKKNGSEWREQTIRITSTQPHYGGRRWWFICPKTGKRCQFLYSAPGSWGFASREAFGLKYECQNKTPEYRTLQRYHRMCDRFGTLDSEPWFPKPKGMHLRTYYKRLALLENLEWRADATFIALLGKRYAI